MLFHEGIGATQDRQEFFANPYQSVSTRQSYQIPSPAPIYFNQAQDLSGVIQFFIK
jgi:hypothetical protein